MMNHTVQAQRALLPNIGKKWNFGRICIELLRLIDIKQIRVHTIFLKTLESVNLKLISNFPGNQKTI